MSDNSTLTCSFCGEPHEETKRTLIAGPNVLICDECVDSCMDILLLNEGHNTNILAVARYMLLHRGEIARFAHALQAQLDLISKVPISALQDQNNPMHVRLMTNLIDSKNGLINCIAPLLSLGDMPDEIEPPSTVVHLKLVGEPDADDSSP
ncbi:MAG: hypothetical protein COY40_02725 [Alphaproteobacteria bacterium CG_4_10_14_0_8_um_filter_53_9]|nr:MAG: hypothetical protein COY40_02725 [Alphaproteobacteria bacterium CG_4_10_14_0_8_um_filter_53_9]